MKYKKILLFSGITVPENDSENISTPVITAVKNETIAKGRLFLGGFSGLRCVVKQSAAVTAAQTIISIKR